MTDFAECLSCAAKPGSPTLCAPCLHNRRLVGELQHQADCRTLAALCFALSALIAYAMARAFL